MAYRRGYNPQALHESLNRVNRLGVQARDRRGRFIARWRSAEEQARNLFLDLLTPEQREELATRGHFTLYGGKTGWRYLMAPGYSGNVVVDHPNRATSLCCHLTTVDAFPTYDHMIAQLLSIRYNEKQFLQAAYPAIYI